ncbi:RNA exonuclease 3 [Exophiala sideris]|uniref:RNA exonuclease 3 n=1 Tax=Exophiala sideris TaxID=1016849 RepID=A0ABR0JS69_9EURO|nr:RNA exonuclease 3 [Exophiala sideris]KAK5043229.1 RNA exonuclease 3 [Exophiala sideris]KAK5068723.1 RNA exonuclease 3 [Exophiala sideris]KAK5186321.1 RNA exonuclease 3 [Eurotiomycetes sp. CCFEE 6388]
MFSALGLFKGIPCPICCIFLHDSPIPSEKAQDASVPTKEYDPFSTGEVHSPPPKRRRLASPEISKDVHDAVRSIPVDSQLPDQPRPLKHASTIPVFQSGNASTAERLPTVRSAPRIAPVSVARTVSPPRTRDSKPIGNQSVRKPTKTESLTPRNVSSAPAMLKTRLAVLQKLHEQMQVQNSKLASVDGQRKALILGDQELIKYALDEEAAATKLGENIYKNAMAQKILRIKKMTIEEWVAAVSTWTGTARQVVAENNGTSAAAELVSTGLGTLEKQTAVLKHLRTPLDGLEHFNYVTSKPSDKDIASAKAGLAAASGWETCDRCGTRFQVFPGRDEHGKLTSHGKCRYHWAKPYRTVGAKSDRILGQSEATYRCCNKSAGSEGCSEAPTHVFYVKDSKRLAGILQWEHTPAKTDIQRRQPVSFDCEMGYTTFGMEVIRLTAVSWPDDKLLLDYLVRPYGEILDLNTRFSGVTQEAFANAPFCQLGSGLDAAPEALRLHKVESPAAARELLFQHLSPDTPLVGHAIENDLNVCRIIHPFVIDTVLLYPHPRGLPIRYGLKMLSQKYLLRTIQSAGEEGHDSKEDAVATGDLVCKKVAEKWNAMRREGWTFVEGMLTAPHEVKPVDAGGQLVPML